MEAIPEPEPTKPRPLKLWVRDNPPSIALIDLENGTATDLLPSLDHLVLEVTPEGAWAQIQVRVDVDAIDWPAEVSHVTPSWSALDGVTAEEVNSWAAMGGASEGPGAAILEHLRARLAGGS